MPEPCLTVQNIFKYLKKGLEREEQARASRHLEHCAQCSEMLSFTKEQLRLGPCDFMSSQTQEKYFQGSLGEEEMREVENHLEGCVSCSVAFEEIASAKPEATAEERTFLRALVTVSVEDRLAPYKNRMILRKTGSKKWPLSRIPQRAALHPTLRWAALVLLLLLPAYFGYGQFQTYRMVKKAEAEFNALTKRVRIADGELRPTGGFEFKLIGAVRSTGPETPSLSAFQPVEEALKRRPEDRKLNRYLGTVYYLEGDQEKARQQFLQALSIDASDAKNYNNLALVDFRADLHEQALERLTLATQLDPQLSEAQYNLALVLESLGDQERAIIAWQRYLSLDKNPDSSWNKVARKHLVTLTED